MLEQAYLFICVFALLSSPFVGSYFALTVFRQNIKAMGNEQRSQCESCGKVLKWYELIPLFSFIIQRGKCRKCKSSIDYRHFLSEIFSTLALCSIGFWGIQHFQNQQLSIYSFIALVFIYIFGLVLLYLAIFDLYTYSIPTALTEIFLILSFAIGIVLNAINILGNNSFDLPIALARMDGIFMSILLALLTYLLILLTKQKGMGSGDIWVVAIIGLYLGWPGAFMAIYFAILVGGIWGIILLVITKNVKGKIVPFVPFLLIGTSLSIIIGEYLFRAIFFT